MSIIWKSLFFIPVVELSHKISKKKTLRSSTLFKKCEIESRTPAVSLGFIDGFENFFVITSSCPIEEPSPLIEILDHVNAMDFSHFPIKI